MLIDRAAPTSALIHKSYRRLLRAALEAVQYSKPARYTIVDKVRRGFRKEGAVFNLRKVAGTEVFLRKAADERGWEHRIVRNLCMCDYWKVRGVRRQIRGQAKMRAMGMDPYLEYNRAIGLLNETLKLSLR
ncbi:DUF1763-domain-containing protein [Ascobolus immersus RN42]|uniref:DUF1763-domain-containing protein n=1 Tax=Ascobolus immersus RN42 TaxID=1160509 RepID=A0A3N4HAT3_ASCIM|nr:DUF1763-domain-containing protein [Ascobolus immersus RN42]